MYGSGAAMVMIRIITHIHPQTIPNAAGDNIVWFVVAVGIPNPLSAVFQNAISSSQNCATHAMASA